MPAEAVTAPVTDKPTGTTTPPDPIDSADGGVLKEDFADLEALDDAPKPQKPAPKPAEKPAAKVTPPKAEPKQKVTAPEPEEEPEELPEPKAEKPQEPAAKTEPKAPEKPVKAADLRTAYEGLKRRVKDELEPEVQSLRAKLKEAEGKPKQDEDLRLALSKLEAAEKRRAELEEEIRFVDYQKSEEYLTKFDQPYKEAWQKALKEIGELSVENEDGTTRQAGPQDLLTISNMNLKEAWEYAKKMFGDAADEIMSHRRKIRELSEAQQKALEDARKNGGERERTKALQAKQAQEKTIALWQESNKAISEKFPRWFAPEDGDEEGNAALAKGFRKVDRMFAATEDNPAPQTQEEAVRLHALVRNKAAAFDRQTLRLKRATARIKELEAEISAFEKSEPHGGEKGGADTTAGGGDNWESEIEAMDRR